MKKIRPSHKYTYLTFLALFAVMTFLFWCMFGTKSWIFKGDYLSERLWVELTYISISLVACTCGALIYRAKVYYMVNDEMIVRHGRELNKYYLVDIVYYDEGYSNKHNDILIYINSGKWVNLTKDPKGELIKLIKEKSPLLSCDEFNFQYPDAFNQKEKIK